LLQPRSQYFLGLFPAPHQKPNRSPVVPDIDPRVEEQAAKALQGNVHLV